MINDAYLKIVDQCWNEKVKTRILPDLNAYGIREEIFESWKHSQKLGVDPMSHADTKVSDEKLKELYAANSNFIAVAYPYLSSLFNNMRGTNYMLQLIDKNACVLKTIYDDELIGRLAHNLSRHSEGYLVSEDVIGTNSSGLALTLQKPIQVIGPEHFQSRNQIFACSSAPIFDDNHELMGCISIMSPTETYKYNILGTVCTIADAIEKELRMKKAFDSLSSANLMLRSCMEAFPKGILFLEPNKNILFYNRMLLDILQLPEDTLTDKNFYDIININSFPAELRELNKNTSNVEITLTNYLGKKLDLVLDISAIYQNNLLASILITFDTQSHSHSVTSKLLNMRAIYTFDSLIGNSQAMRDIKTFGLTAAQSVSNILILGESGTGKELLAQAIHNAGPRARNPFVAVNCGSIPKNLIESELFGYEYGAFSGAGKSGSPGKFELANKGTIFLDEIGDMPFELQIALLRVLQEKEITRLGGKQAKQLDVRIIAATNKNLPRSIAENQFRSDLYYRLNVLNITIPPLRERKDDIQPLAQYFIKQYSSALNKQISGITREGQEAISAYKWPGNIRELENTIERAVNSAAGDMITVEELAIPESMNQEGSLAERSFSRDKMPFSAGPQPEKANFGSGRSPEFKEYEELVALFIREKGHTKTVAEILNLPLSTLYGKLRKYSINPKDYKKWD